MSNSKRTRTITLHGDRSGWLGTHDATKSADVLSDARNLAKGLADQLGEPVEAWCHNGADDTSPVQFRTRHVPTVPSPAFSAGSGRGTDSASWVEIASADDARRLLGGIADGDPEIMDLCPSPLSGEWAGESVSELSALYYLDLAKDPQASDFEAGFSEGFFAELERRASALLPTAADVLGDAGFTGYCFTGAYLTGSEWVDMDVPGPGESASLSDFSMSGTPTHFEMPVTLWGDYCGSDCARSNYRALLEAYPDTFVEVSGDYFSRLLLIPATISLEMAESLVGIGVGLRDEYPLFDEEDHSALEMEEAEEAWEAWARDDLRRALADARVPDEDLDEISDEDLSEAFYAAVWASDDCPHFESATSIHFPMWDKVVAQLAEKFGAQS